MVHLVVILIWWLGESREGHEINYISLSSHLDYRIVGHFQRV